MRSGKLFDAKLKLSFERDKVAVGNLSTVGAGAYAQLQSVNRENFCSELKTTVINRGVLRNADTLPELEEAKLIVLEERKKAISEQINQITKLNPSLIKNENTKKFLLIKEVLEDFIENILFYEKQSVISIMAKKTVEGRGFVSGTGEEGVSALRPVYIQYDDHIEKLKTINLATNLKLALPTLDEFIANPVYDAEEWINNIQDTITEYTDTTVGNDIFGLLQENWFQSLNEHTKLLIARINMIANGSLDDEISQLTDHINAFNKTYDKPSQVFEDKLAELVELKALVTHAETKIEKAKNSLLSPAHTVLKAINVEEDFREACKRLNNVIDKKDTSEESKKIGRRTLACAQKIYKQNMITKEELPTLTKFVNGTANVLDDPSAEHREAHINNTVEALSMKRPWGKMIGGAMIGVCGGLLITLSIGIAIATFGGATPLSALGLALGGGMILASSTIAVMGVTGLALTTAATLFSNRARKEIVAKEKLVEEGILLQRL